MHNAVCEFHPNYSEKKFRNMRKRSIYSVFLRKKWRQAMCSTPFFNRIREALCSQFRRAIGIHADEFTLPAFIFKFDEAFDHRKQRVVFAAANIIARLPFCATLASENIAAKYVLAAELLQTEPLRLRVPAVT
jgi:hypothetical protein